MRAPITGPQRNGKGSVAFGLKSLLSNKACRVFPGMLKISVLELV